MDCPAFSMWRPFLGGMLAAIVALFIAGPAGVLLAWIMEKLFRRLP